MFISYLQTKPSLDLGGNILPAAPGVRVVWESGLIQIPVPILTSGRMARLYASAWGMSRTRDSGAVIGSHHVGRRASVCIFDCTIVFHLPMFTIKLCT